MNIVNKSITKFLLHVLQILQVIKKQWFYNFNAYSYHSLEEPGPGEPGLDAPEKGVGLGVDDPLVLGELGQHRRYLSLRKPSKLRQELYLQVNLEV